MQTILLLKSAFLCVFRFFGLSSFDTVTTLILSRLASFHPFFEVIPEILQHFAIVDVAKLPMYEGTSSQLLLEKIDNLSSQVAALRRNPINTRRIEPSPEEEKAAKDLIRTMIDRFCDEYRVKEPQILSNKDLTMELYDYVERNSEICMLCKNRNNLEKFVYDSLIPF